MVDAGLIKKNLDGNRTYYRADVENPVFPELQSLMIKTAGLVDHVKAAVHEFGDRLKLAFIYGSMADRDERSSSDVDLLLVGDVRLLEAAQAVKPLEKLLSRPVNPTVYSQAEFRAKFRAGNHFLTAVINGPKLFIIGTERDLAAIANGGTSPTTPGE